MSLSKKNKDKAAASKYPQAYVEDDCETRTQALFFTAKRNRKLFSEAPIRFRLYSFKKLEYNR